MCMYVCLISNRNNLSEINYVKFSWETAIFTFYRIQKAALKGNLYWKQYGRREKWPFEKKSALEAKHSWKVDQIGSKE